MLHFELERLFVLLIRKNHCYTHGEKRGEKEECTAQHSYDNNYSGNKNQQKQSSSLSAIIIPQQRKAMVVTAATVKQSTTRRQIGNRVADNYNAASI